MSLPKQRDGSMLANIQMEPTPSARSRARLIWDVSRTGGPK
jgi:hypothetical protein